MKSINNGKSTWPPSNLYLSIDVLLLCDIFEEFRESSLETYELDPCWFYTLPGLAWEAAFKYTKEKIELLTDYDMLLFFEESIRGGFCFASKRYAKANHAKLPSYDPNKPHSWIWYIDANNLYGAAMSKPLPHSNYKWMSDEWLQEFEKNGGELIKTLDDDCDGGLGFLFEVDLEYPKELHDRHNDFPLCPEQICMSETSKTVSKLISTLHNKKKYIVHHAYLKRALREGLILKKIHRGIQFEQRSWLKPYIELNTKLRKEATSSFHKDLFKLMNNAVFGKSMENVRNRRLYKLTSDEQVISKYMNRYTCINRTIISDRGNLTLIELENLNVTFNKPLQVGAAILDISKCVMLDFHYGEMLPMIDAIGMGASCELMYGDTDSLIYHITLPSNLDFYADVVHPNLDKFDLSDYPNDHFLHSDKNKKALGKFSDETPGRFLGEWVGLRAKLYAFKLYPSIYGAETDEVKKAKGVKKYVVTNDMKFEDYLRILRTEGVMSIAQVTFKSEDMLIHTVEQQKIALSANDDKRYICSDGVSTLAWGHYKLTEIADSEIIISELDFRKRLRKF